MGLNKTASGSKEYFFDKLGGALNGCDEIDSALLLRRVITEVNLVVNKIYEDHIQLDENISFSKESLNFEGKNIKELNNELIHFLDLSTVMLERFGGLHCFYAYFYKVLDNIRTFELEQQLGNEGEIIKKSNIIIEDRYVADLDDYSESLEEKVVEKFLEKYFLNESDIEIISICRDETDTPFKKSDFERNGLKYLEFKKQIVEAIEGKKKAVLFLASM